MTFAKLDGKIIHSSLWSEKYHVRIVFLTMLALKDDVGFVASSGSGIQRASNVTVEECFEAIKILESPDKDSMTEDDDGRRIEKIEGGWVVLNHEKYRLPEDVKRDQTRARVCKFREKKSNSVTSALQSVTDALPSVSVSNSLSIHEKTFEKFWSEYPKKKSKGDALKAWNKVKTPAETLAKILTALEWQKKSTDWIKEHGQYIPYPATYIRSNGWEDEYEQQQLNLNTPRRIIQ